MTKEKNYKKLYLDLEKKFKNLLRHKTFHNVKRCKDCKIWYKETIEETEMIKNKQLKESLLEVWETLWLNDCTDFDIIANIFEVKK